MSESRDSLLGYIFLYCVFWRFSFVPCAKLLMLIDVASVLTLLFFIPPFSSITNRSLFHRYHVLCVDLVPWYVTKLSTEDTSVLLEANANWNFQFLVLVPVLSSCPTFFGLPLTKLMACEVELWRGWVNLRAWSLFKQGPEIVKIVFSFVITIHGTLVSAFVPWFFFSHIVDSGGEVLTTRVVYCNVVSARCRGRFFSFIHMFWQVSFFF